MTSSDPEEGNPAPETASDEEAAPPAPGAEKSEDPEARPEGTGPQRAEGTPAERASAPPERSYPLPHDDPLDLSTHGFRQLLGGLGIALPPLCWLWASLLPPRGTTEGLLARLWPLRSLDSVSAYYHTSAVWAFVGILVAMSLFLFTYRGYNDRRQRLDYWVSNFAGAMALLVAIFPTTSPDEVPDPVWWSPAMEAVHSGAALLLFVSFVVFCWFLFPTKDKRVSESTRRDRGYASLTFRQRVRKYPVYYGCGLGIVVCLVYAGAQIRNGGPIFMPEWWALWFFGISWLRKGQVLWSLRRLGRRMAGAAGS